MYGSEVWTLSKSDENNLTYGKENIKKNIWPCKKNGIWGIRTNQELVDLYKELDIVSEIRKGRLRWLGHVERMP
jgi:hypothetical protein